MTRHLASASLAVALAVTAFPAAFAAAQQQPNVLFIMGDDHAWPLYRFMWEISEAQINANNPRHEELKDFPHDTFHPDFQLGDEFQTPGLDRLAARGAVFPVGHSGATVCIPSYQSTLTGLYRKDFDHAPPGRVAMPYLPEYLAHAGYKSFGYGKIWQSSFGDAGFTCANGSFDCTAESQRSQRIGRLSVSPLLGFMAREPGPWFAWYAPTLPHAPLDAAKLVKETLFGSRGTGLDLSSPQLAPGARQRLTETYDRMVTLQQASTASPKLQKRAKYSQNILLLDFWVGEILNFLEQPGNEALNANTMIVFMSDNGFRMPHSKRSFGENGFRTPVLVSLPGPDPAQPRIRPNQVLPQMVHAIDLLPTLLDYAGMPIMQCAAGAPIAFPPWVQGGSPLPCLDGQSLRPYLEGSTSPGRQYLLGVSKHGDRYLRALRREPLGAAPSQQHPVTYRLTLDVPKVKGTRRKGSCQFHLFNLHIDPDETIDLMRAGGFDNRDGSLETWQRELMQWYDPNVCFGG